MVNAFQFKEMLDNGLSDLEKDVTDERLRKKAVNEGVDGIIRLFSSFSKPPLGHGCLRRQYEIICGLA
jgi:hypothetical protein